MFLGIYLVFTRSRTPMVTYHINGLTCKLLPYTCHMSGTFIGDQAIHGGTAPTSGTSVDAETTRRKSMLRPGAIDPLKFRCKQQHSHTHTLLKIHFLMCANIYEYCI